MVYPVVSVIYPSNNWALVERHNLKGHCHGDFSPGGVLRDPSDGDVRRIFLGSKFSIPGFFWVGEFGRYFFG